MFIKNNQISGRQTARLFAFDLMGYSALLVPGILAQSVGNDGLFSILLGGMAGFCYLSILQSVRDRMQGGYADSFCKYFGNIIGNGCKVLYLVYFLLLAGRVACVFAELVVKELIEERFSLVLFLLMVLVYYGVSGGIEGRARVYEILFWILMIPLFIMILLALPAVDVDYWIPIGTVSFGELIKGAYQVFLCVPILFLLPFFEEFVNVKGQVYRCGKRALVWTFGILVVLYLILLGMFGKEALATLDYPVVTMMSRIQMKGGFFKRADALMFGIWFFTLFALLNSCVFFGGRLWKQTKKMCSIWLFLEVLTVYVLAYAFHYSDGFTLFFEKFFAYVGTPFVIAVPILSGFATGWGRRNEE